MPVRQFTYDDIDAFLRTSFIEEGWLCNRWELEYLLRTFPQGCLVYMENEVQVAFVTSIAYGASGWLGNLIVRKNWRRKGIGRILTECAIESLQSAGVGSVWLAATDKGKGLYQELGFTNVDTINQWAGLGRSGKQSDTSGMDVNLMISLDLAYWGIRRETLIDAISRRGTVFALLDSFLVMQLWDYGFYQLSSWVGKNLEVMNELLNAALVQISPADSVFLFAPSKNKYAADLLSSQGFNVMGSSKLMCLGNDSTYNPKYIFSLTSLILG